MYTLESVSFHICESPADQEKLAACLTRFLLRASRLAEHADLLADQSGDISSPSSSRLVFEPHSFEHASDVDDSATVNLLSMSDIIRRLSSRRVTYFDGTQNLDEIKARDGVARIFAAAARRGGRIELALLRRSLFPLSFHAFVDIEKGRAIGRFRWGQDSLPDNYRARIEKLVACWGLSPSPTPLRFDERPPPLADHNNRFPAAPYAGTLLDEARSYRSLTFRIYRRRRFMVDWMRGLAAPARRDHAAESRAAMTAALTRFLLRFNEAVSRRQLNGYAGGAAVFEPFVWKMTAPDSHWPAELQCHRELLFADGAPTNKRAFHAGAARMIEQAAQDGDKGSIELLRDHGSWLRCEVDIDVSAYTLNGNFRWSNRHLTVTPAEYKRRLKKFIASLKPH